MLRELVDGFALVVVAGLCFVVVLPHVIGEIGPAGLALAAAGVFIPLWGHRLGRRRVWSLSLAVVALLVHVVLDGAVLATRADAPPLAWAVVAHRLPVGFAIVVAAQESRRPLWIAWGLAGTMVLATVVGFVAGPAIWVGGAGSAALEAVVAGLLLHVVFVPHQVFAKPTGDHGHHDCSASHRDTKAGHGLAEDRPGPRSPTRPRSRRWAAAGALLGLLVMAAGPFVSPHAFESTVPTCMRTLGVLVLESAPALLLGYALAGVVPFLLTPTRTASLGHGSGLMQSLRGIAFGLPLPVCSCGVLPLYESLIRRGAPPIAAMAFFVATPELGLDAVLLSVPLLGSSLTVARVVAAFAVALVVALLVGGRPRKSAAALRDPAPDATQAAGLARIRAGLRFGFVDVFDHTMPWIALGLLIAAMAEPLLSHGAIASIPVIFQVPLAALVGVPVYVCASGATPVAALALHKGLSAGAAVSFLIAGPATNVTTFGVLARLHGRRTALTFGVSVAVLAVLAGWTVDALGIRAAPVLDAHADAHGSWLDFLCAGGLAVLTVASLVRQGPRGALRQILQPIHVH
jgi:hypothetical protein